MRTIISNRAGWIFLTVLILMTLVCVTLFFPRVQAGIAAVLAGPRLSIPDNIPADPGSIVDIPVRFTSNGNNIASLVFFY